LAGWTINRAFDSASDCEAARAAMIAEASKNPLDENGRTKQEFDRWWENEPAEFPEPPKPEFKPTIPNPQARAVCIATDDPRLAK
jgi:hypothetical protein